MRNLRLRSDMGDDRGERMSVDEITQGFRIGFMEGIG